MKNTDEPDYAVPPGNTLEEHLHHFRMQDHSLNRAIELFAKDMKVCESDIECFIDGELILTNDFANRLEKNTGIPERIWMNLEKNYRERLTILDEEN